MWLDRHGIHGNGLCIFIIGDPCIIGTETELAEAIRLYDVNMDAELTIHGKFWLPTVTYLR